MKQHTLNKTAGVIFLIIAVLHLTRIFYGWKAVINGWSVPTGLSWAVVIVVGYLAFQALELAKRG